MRAGLRGLFGSECRAGLRVGRGILEPASFSRWSRRCRRRKRGGRPGDATGLGDELIGDEVRRDLVQDARYLEREWTLTAQLAGRAERHCRDAAAYRRHGALCARLEFGLLERRSSASRVGKWRYSVERPRFAAAASSAIVTRRSPTSARAATRIRCRLATASARLGPAAPAPAGLCAARGLCHVPLLPPRTASRARPTEPCPKRRPGCPRFLLVRVQPHRPGTGGLRCPIKWDDSIADDIEEAQWRNQFQQAAKGRRGPTSAPNAATSSRSSRPSICLRC